MTERFEQERPRLRAVAYRMLGSASEADDAVQEAWLRFDRTDMSEIENVGAWLTTVVARLCLSMLRTRRNHREEPLDGRPEPGEDRRDPEQEAELADSVGLALLVVLDALAPAERVAFVLHDMFAVPFDEIAASRGGDFDALLALLDPDVVLHADRFVGPSPAPVVLRGVENVRKGAVLASERARASEPALVDGSPGLLWIREGRLSVVLAFRVDGERITGIDVIADPDRLRGLELAVLD